MRKFMVVLFLGGIAWGLAGNRLYGMEREFFSGMDRAIYIGEKGAKVPEKILWEILGKAVTKFLLKCRFNKKKESWPWAVAAMNPHSSNHENNGGES